VGEIVLHSIYSGVEERREGARGDRTEKAIFVVKDKAFFCRAIEM
jgi:hypothetical protein